MQLPIYRQTVEATGVDPDAPPTLPTVPHWMEAPEDRPVMVDDDTTATSELPVVEVDGKWCPEGDHGSPDEAAARVRWLNGGPEPRNVVDQLDALDVDDPEAAHGEADELLLSLVPAEVADAYRRVVKRADWWAAA